MATINPAVWNGVPVPYEAPLAELLATAQQPGPQAWAAIRALAAKPEAEALAALARLARSADPQVRRSAIEALGLHLSGRAASEVIGQALQESDPLTVRAAIDAATRLGLDSAHERVLGLINTSDPATRLAALRALEALWQPQDFEAVFERYRRDPSDAVRKQAAWTLRRNVGAEHWAQLFATWSSDPLPRHRVWACQLAALRGSSRSSGPGCSANRSRRPCSLGRAASSGADRTGLGPGRPQGRAVGHSFFPESRQARWRVSP
jgi:hypothetical protein